MFFRPLRLRLSKKRSKFAEQFAEEQKRMREMKDHNEKRGIAYVFPECKKHIPKPEPVKMKVLFCSKTIKSLAIPLYK